MVTPVGTVVTAKTRVKIVLHASARGLARETRVKSGQQVEVFLSLVEQYQPGAPPASIKIKFLIITAVFSMQLLLSSQMPCLTYVIVFCYHTCQDHVKYLILQGKVIHNISMSVYTKD